VVLLARIAVIGCGYVGGVTAACLAELGHQVDCIDISTERIAMYRRGTSPIYEPGLEELIRKGISSGLLTFYDEYPERIEAEIVFIAVNTPGSAEGAADLRSVRDAVSMVAPRMKSGSVIVNKSTVPIGTGNMVDGMVRRCTSKAISVVSNPEFLREGSALRDFMNPDRIVLGSESSSAIQQVEALYSSLGARVIRVDIRTAEMIKYASNAFLATKISFINEIASICESLGADVLDVARGMGLDERIGPRFLAAGLGWGGSCFPKDVRALAHMASVHGTHPQLLRSVMDINDGQKLRTIGRLRDVLGSLENSRVLILGAAFKAQTDDLRNSPAIDLANLLAHEGADVVIVDPVVPAERIKTAARSANVANSIAEGAADADVIVLATDWPEYIAFDYGTIAEAMHRKIIFDGRNALASEDLRNAGFAYLCMGRPGAELAKPVPEPLEAFAAAGGQ
jgi:UDPglucose 6-dehydrogenase